MSLRAYSHNIAVTGGSSASDATIFTATCDSTVAVGDVVRFNAGIIVRAQANNVTNARIVGLCESKTSATTCVVRVAGVTASNYSGLDLTLDYYLSDTVPGGLQTTVPTAGASVILLIGRPHTTTALAINIGQAIVRA